MPPTRAALWGRHLPCFVLFLFVWGEIAATASAQFLLPPCQIELVAARDAYLHQDYEAALNLASSCTRGNGVSNADLIRAHRLMSLSFFRRHALVEARSSITHILSIDPTYEADPVQDPPSYALLVSMVRAVLGVDTGSTHLVHAVLAADSVGLRLPAAPLLSVDLGSDPLSQEPIAVSSFQEMGASRGALLDERASDPAVLATNGVRLTIRNRGYERINGLNLTLWRPPPTTSNGGVSGLALGLPTTGTAHLNGIGVGLVGVTGSEALRGIGIGGLGLTAGSLHGLALGGIGLRVRDHLHGISLNGGLTVGSGSLRGIAVSGLGVAVGGSVGGLQVSGLGVRAGEGIGGITAGLLGASSGGHLTGLTVTSGFIHAGGAIRGVHVTGGPLIADRVQGLALGSVVVQRSGAGLFVAPLYTHTGADGTLTGLSLSTFNHVRGRQRGLTIGLVNVARNLGGVQLGLLNYAGNNPRFLRLLPGLNVHF